MSNCGRARSRRLTRVGRLESPVEPGVPPRSSLSATKLLELVHQLKPLDRQIILLYLEGEGAEQIESWNRTMRSNKEWK